MLKEGKANQFMQHMSHNLKLLIRVPTDYKFWLRNWEAENKPVAAIHKWRTIDNLLQIFHGICESQSKWFHLWYTKESRRSSKPCQFMLSKVWKEQNVSFSLTMF